MSQNETTRTSRDATTQVARQRHPFLMIWVIVGALLGGAACGQEMVAGAGALAPTPNVTVTSQVQSSGQGSVVEVTPMPDAELAAQPSGESEPGAATSEEPQADPGAAATSETVPADPGASNEQPQPGSTVVYADRSHRFEVAYPEDFVFRTEPAEKLAGLTPKPDAWYTFMNPGAASSDAPELEPADLEIRIYVIRDQPAPLETWLISNGLLPADGSVRPKPFQKGNVSGLEGCASTMIAPGCSYFVLGNGRVYQFIPASLEGEAIIETVKLTS